MPFNQSLAFNMIKIGDVRMLKRAFCGISTLFLATFLSATALAADLPTLHQVYQAAESGNYTQAQAMMKQVLQAHPNSAKAHFVEAELLAKQGQYAQAKSELDTAERLQPGLPFAKPQAVADLTARIAGTAAHPIPFGNVYAARPPSFPWGMLALGIGAVVLIVLFVRTLSARRPTGPTNYAPMGMPQASPVGLGPAPMQSGGGIGSTLATGLATGVAVGAGMVAGEALANHFLNGNSSGAGVAGPVSDTWNPPANDNMGGNDFGIADGSSWDDNSALGDGMSDIGGGDDWS
jgi:hypothetical protein